MSDAVDSGFAGRRGPDGAEANERGPGVSEPIREDSRSPLTSISHMRDKMSFEERAEEDWWP